VTVSVIIRDSDDPYRHSAAATQREPHMWDVVYRRGAEVVSTGSISVPHHHPPTSTMLAELESLRQEAYYWDRFGR
jgi:hypothetical protein